MEIGEDFRFRKLFSCHGKAKLDSGSECENGNDGLSETSARGKKELNKISTIRSI